MDLQRLSCCFLTVGLSHPNDQLRVKGLPQPLGVHQLHGAVLQAVFDVGKDGLVPCVQHQLRTQAHNDGVLTASSSKFWCGGHLPNDAVLYVGLLVASLFAHQGDLQLAERFGQDVALREELPPLHDVRFEQGRVVLMTQHALSWRQTVVSTADVWI